MACRLHSIRRWRLLRWQYGATRAEEALGGHHREEDRYRGCLQGWPGGKRQLAKTLLSLIPEHEIYVEVFAGSAKLLFAKPQSRCEIINDLNGDVVNFFRMVKHRPAALAELFDHEVVHAERFRNLRCQTMPDDELHRALRFVYLTWYSFGGKGDNFASSNAKELDKGSLDRVRNLLDLTAVRLRKVLLEQRSFGPDLTRTAQNGCPNILVEDWRWLKPGLDLGRHSNSPQSFPDSHPSLNTGENRRARSGFFSLECLSHYLYGEKRFA